MISEKCHEFLVSWVTFSPLPFRIAASYALIPDERHSNRATKKSCSFLAVSLPCVVSSSARFEFVSRPTACAGQACRNADHQAWRQSQDRRDSFNTGCPFRQGSQVHGSTWGERSRLAPHRPIHVDFNAVCELQSSASRCIAGGLPLPADLFQ